MNRSPVGAPSGGSVGFVVSGVPVDGRVPDPWLVADADVVTAMAGSVLGTLPSERCAVNLRPAYLGATITSAGRSPGPD